MSTIIKELKNSPVVAALFSVVFAAGGINAYSETTEADDSDAFRAADERQDARHDELLQMYNDLKLEVALLEITVTER